MAENPREIAPTGIPVAVLTVAFRRFDIKLSHDVPGGQHVDHPSLGTMRWEKALAWICDNAERFLKQEHLQQTRWFESPTFYVVLGSVLSAWDVGKELITAKAELLPEPYKTLAGMALAGIGCAVPFAWMRYRKWQSEHLANQRIAALTSLGQSPEAAFPPPQEKSPDGPQGQ